MIASVKPFQILGPEFEMHFWPIDFLHFGRVSSEEVAFRVPKLWFSCVYEKSLFI